MKSIITSIAFAMTFFTTANAQTTAPNWTANDCNSISHTLYTELDNGKVIVFVWVMPCVSCVTPAKTAYAEVQSFAASHPGQVLYYLADDYGDAGCSALSNWVTANNIGDVSKITFFENAGNTINMNDFGGAGMPKVVVMGGPNHKIFFNKNNGAANDASGINAAIASAISATNISNLENTIRFSFSPNPTTDHIFIDYAKAIRKVSITAINGQLVKEISYEGGKINPEIETSELTKGVYLLKVIDINGETGIQKIVKQ